jgi:hypothetical protein
VIANENMIAFTGTRKGMTDKQKEAVLEFLKELRGHDYLFRHGDCVGADADFHWLVHEAEFELRGSVAIHPCTLEAQRAHCEPALIVYAPREPLARNREMVDRAEFLLACPGEEHEVLRSGTWATIRYAKKRNVPRLVILPSGRVWNGL